MVGERFVTESQRHGGRDLSMLNDVNFRKLNGRIGIPACP